MPLSSSRVLVSYIVSLPILLLAGLPQNQAIVLAFVGLSTTSSTVLTLTLLPPPLLVSSALLRASSTSKSSHRVNLDLAYHESLASSALTLSGTGSTTTLTP